MLILKPTVPKGYAKVFQIPGWGWHYDTFKSWICLYICCPTGQGLLVLSFLTLLTKDLSAERANELNMLSYVLFYECLLYYLPSVWWQHAIIKFKCCTATVNSKNCWIEYRPVPVWNQTTGECSFGVTVVRVTMSMAVSRMKTELSVSWNYD